MELALVLALVTSSAGADPYVVRSGQLWEEPAIMQKMPGDHPMIRFNTPSTMIRFSPATNYMLSGPPFIQQGEYHIDGDNYRFTAYSAIELERADILKFCETMDRESALQLQKKYAESTLNFQGTYNRTSGALTISYPFKGTMKTFQLFPTDFGDDKISRSVPRDAESLIGLWQMPEPFPGKLDARTRAKIELDGLSKFSGEAEKSNQAQFGLMDLKPDGAFRLHGMVGIWKRDGSTLSISAGGGKMLFQISPDNRKLFKDGKQVFEKY